jgi:hypothetical protein
MFLRAERGPRSAAGGLVPCSVVVQRFSIQWKATWAFVTGLVTQSPSLGVVSNVP